MEESGFIHLMPFLFVSIIFIIFNIMLSIGKGKNVILNAILSIVPFLNFMVFLYLVSLPSKDIVEKIDYIYKSLKQ